MEKIIKSRKYLNLPMDDSKLYLIENDLFERINELESFLDGIEYMKKLKFSKKVLFGQEIKSNNTIEGYMDDIEVVRSIIKHPSSHLNEEQKMRILNLYKGYKYILEGKSIDENTLKELYKILSRKLLSSEDLSNMGEYYRLNEEYIFYSSRLDKEPDKGVNPSLVKSYMDLLLEYLNQDNMFNCMTDYFIKSQIAHFYFVYVHPYYDINGRTARTTAMWYLLNNESYPYIIFNRAIQLDKNTYYKVIRDGKKYHNVTYFLNYMLENVLIELEKEYVMEMIKSLSNEKLNEEDEQTLYYILSMKSVLTFYDFGAFYNRFNEHKKPHEIYNLMLESLIDKGIIIPGRNTNKGDNRFFSLNKRLIEIDDKVKKLNLESKI